MDQIKDSIINLTEQVKNFNSKIIKDNYNNLNKIM